MEQSAKKELQTNLETYRKHSLILWGAGLYGKKILEQLRFFSLSAVAFCDNNADLWGTELEGIPVISPETLKSRYASGQAENQKVLIQIALYPKHERYEELTQQIQSQLQQLGFSTVFTTTFAMETLFFLSVMTQLKRTALEVEQLIDHHYLLEKNHHASLFLTEGYKKLIPQKPIRSFILNIVDHCNLNCQRCDHFSPLAQEKFVSLASIETDIKQMSHLLHASLDKLKIEGGEALLHPHLLDIFALCRRYFPQTKLLLMTNGILLLQQEEVFWKECRKNGVVLAVTKYPVNFDYDKAKQVAQAHQVEYEYFGGDLQVKTSYKLSLDQTKGQDPMGSFLHCHRANDCIYLMEGKFYLCPTVSNVTYLNQSHGTDFQVEAEDYLEIHQLNSGEELAEFVAKPCAFCRYCMTKLDADEIPWAVSKKHVNEWLPVQDKES